MARLARKTVVWKPHGSDVEHTCSYTVPLHHSQKEQAKQVNEKASKEDRDAVAAYNSATASGSAVIVGIDTVEVAD